MIQKRNDRSKLKQSFKELRNRIIMDLERTGFNRFLKTRQEPYNGEEFSLHIIDILDALQSYNEELGKIESLPSAMDKKELDIFGDSLSDLVEGSLDELKFHILQIGSLLLMFEDFIKEEKMELPEFVKGVWVEKAEELKSKLSEKEAQEKIARLQGVFSQFDFKEKDVLAKKLIRLSQESGLIADIMNQFVDALSLQDIEKTLNLTVQTQFWLSSVLPTIFVCQELTRRFLHLVCMINL